MEREEYNLKLMQLNKKDLIDYFWRKVDAERETNIFHIEKSKRLGRQIEKLNKLRIIPIEENIGRECLIFEVSKRGMQRSYRGIISKETSRDYTINIKNKCNEEWEYTIPKENITGIKWHHEGD